MDAKILPERARAADEKLTTVYWRLESTCGERTTRPGPIRVYIRNNNSICYICMLYVCFPFSISFVDCWKILHVLDHYHYPYRNICVHCQMHKIELWIGAQLGEIECCCFWWTSSTFTFDYGRIEAWLKITIYWYCWEELSGFLVYREYAMNCMVNVHIALRSLFYLHNWPIEKSYENICGCGNCPVSRCP